MHISVIIPAYNAERFLEAAIESVFSQTHSDWDLVIVDNASTDTTGALAARYAKLCDRLAVVSLTKNVGPGGARNAGLASLKSDPTSGVMFLDADDVLRPDAMEVLSEGLASVPKMLAVHGNAEYIDIDGVSHQPGQLEAAVRSRPYLRFGRLVREDTAPRTTFDSLVIWCSITTPGMVLVRRTAIDQVGAFDPSCRPAEDWDMWIRLARCGDFGFLDHVVLGYRLHPFNMSHQKRTMRRGEKLVVRKTRLDPATSVAQCQLLADAWRAQTKYGAVAKLRSARAAAHERKWLVAGMELQRAARWWSASVLGPTP